MKESWQLNKNLTILNAVKAQFFKFTTAHPGTWVGEGCYVILGTMLQGCNEKLKTALPRQESTVYISSAKKKIRVIGTLNN